MCFLPFSRCTSAWVSAVLVTLVTCFHADKGQDGNHHEDDEGQCRSIAEVCNALTHGVVVDVVRHGDRCIRRTAVGQVDRLIEQLQGTVDGHDGGHHDGGHQQRNSDLPERLPAVGTVNFGCFVHRIVDVLQTGQIEADDLNRKEAIKSNRKEAVHYLKEIDSGKLHHYYFLPQAAYLDNEIKSKGLIVDLLEIESLTLKDAQKIANPLAEGILYQDLPPLPTIEELSQVNEFDALRERFKERLRLEKTFWLKDSSDFVQIEGTIKSPWCEHLMQRFSNVFIRIGLDNPSEDDYNTLIDGCCLEE